MLLLHMRLSHYIAGKGNCETSPVSRAIFDRLTSVSAGSNKPSRRFAHVVCRLHLAWIKNLVSPLCQRHRL
jgi:hypothetical protein